MKRENLLAKKHLYLALLAMGAATPAFAQSLTTLTTFHDNGAVPGYTVQGFSPVAGLVVSPDGSTLYGTTPVGGPGATYGMNGPQWGGGTVFSTSVSGSGGTKVLASFSPTNGDLTAGVTLSANGSTLYGYTNAGGTNGDGYVFSLSTAYGSSPTTLANFTNAATPNTATGSLTLVNNTLYGSTPGYGGLFSVPVTGISGGSGNVNMLTSVDGGGGGTLLYSSGTLYGTNYSGVYSYNIASGNYTTLAAGNNSTGDGPVNPSGLAISADGKTLYGSMYYDGANGDGTVFSIPTAGGNLSVLGTFVGAEGYGGNGYHPTGVTLVGNTLYGTNIGNALFSVPVTGGNITSVVNFGSYNGNGTYNPATPPVYDPTTGSIYGTCTGSGEDNGSAAPGAVYGMLLPTGATATTYTLAAAITGNRVVNGRITQGQTGNLTATINNTGGNGTDNLAYDTLSITGSTGISIPTPGSGNIAPAGNGTASGTFTATTLGTNTFNPSVGNATNATVGNTATCGGNTCASVYVDALAQHVNAATITDTGNASTTPTAFYRQNAAWGGQNLGNITVSKQGPGSYIPGYCNNINGGAGTAVGSLKITVSGSDNMFGSDTSIIMLGFQNVNHLGTGSGSLTTIEGALTAAGIEWRDYTNNSNAWPALTHGVDPLTGTSFFQNVADYDIELAFNPNTLTSNTSYFDFNFADQLGTAGDVVNIVAVPEPATLSLLALGSGCLLARRRRKAA